MRPSFKVLIGVLATYLVLLVLHLPLLRLPYYWDEAGYYIPAALDFYRSWLLVPATTLPTGHTPLVPIYLGLVWHLLGCSVGVTRAALTLVAAATAVSLYLLARRVASREIAVWSALLLALSPLFFAQSTLAHLDLSVALFTTLAVLFVLREQLWLFALAATLAILSKETAVVLLPVVWLCAWRQGRGTGAKLPIPAKLSDQGPLTPAPLPQGGEGRAGWRRLRAWAPLLAPLVPLAAWALYYHHVTGFWTGNREYLSYNLYSTLSPVHVFLTLLRRVYELFIGGFHWLLIGAAAGGLWWGRKTRGSGSGTRDSEFGTRDSGRDAKSGAVPDGANAGSAVRPWRPFIFLAVGLVAIYLLLLSLVGGAILPRYFLPIFPVFYLVTVALITRLPRLVARLILTAVAACLVWAWFINPPYPFPYEDNLAYADFIRLHQLAAHYLETRPGQPRILTAWPATDELHDPRLGYVQRPLSVVPVDDFAPQRFASVPPASFDLICLYSRQWEPPGNWLDFSPRWLRMQARYFSYHPQIDPDVLAARYHLRLMAAMERRGQWVWIYARDSR
jgi:hypothetical protein